MNLVLRASDLFGFYGRAQTVHNIHSPFVFGMLEAIFDESDVAQLRFDKIENMRSQLLADQTPLTKPPIGAPSKSRGKNLATIASEARGSLMPAWQNRWLYRLAKYVKPNHMLELGSSFGIGSLYQVAGVPNASMLTIEGNPEVAARAEDLFARSGRKGQIELRKGLFDQILPTLRGPYDYVFIDGDHRGSSLMNYLEMARNLAATPCTLILHDIHWSQDMLQTWQAIRRDYAVSIDLYVMGILIADQQRETPLHFDVVPGRWKPWKLGLWS